MRTDIIEHKDKILNFIQNKFTLTQIALIFNCKIDTLKRYLKKLDIEYHGHPGNFSVSLKRIPASEYLKKSSCRPLVLKHKLFKENIKEKICEECKLKEWMGQPIPLHLHHEDGNRANNDLSNLKILCMNCHGLTENFGSKNTKKKIYNEDLVIKVTEEKIIQNKDIVRKIFKKKFIKQNKVINQKYGTQENYRLSKRIEWDAKQYKKIPLILNSQINFSKFGWVDKVSNILNIKSQKVNKWMKRIMPEFYEKECFKKK